MVLMGGCSVLGGSGPGETFYSHSTFWAILCKALGICHSRLHGGDNGPCHLLVSLPGSVCLGLKRSCP